MKLWVDSVNGPPKGWEWARMYAVACAMLSEGLVDELSVGGDADEDGRTANDVILLSECLVKEGIMSAPKLHRHDVWTEETREEKP